MRNKEILKLVAGFRRFREKYFQGENSMYSSLSSTGQHPKTLIIGCSDSRVDPAILSSASPGELFVVRNVANLVPPYESAKTGFHGVSAAIEFAICNIKVENLVVLGHRQCGGIRAMMSGETKSTGESFVNQWMTIAERAKERVLEKFAGESLDIQCRACEQEAIVTSMENLRTFPFVQKAVEAGTLNIFGIYFDLEQGQLLEYDEPTGEFRAIGFEQRLLR